METLSLDISYRPIRFGWCIRKGDFAGLRKAILLTHTLYGGRYNPIIIIDDKDYANSLIELFAVDTLYAVSPDSEITTFIEGYKHLRWPIIHKSFFIDGTNGVLANYLDIYHSIRKIKEGSKVLNPQTDYLPVIFKWSEEDLLKDVFLMTFGDLPEKNEYGIDYSEYITNPNVYRIDPSESVMSNSYSLLTINRMTTYGLYPYGDWQGRMGDGIYYGSAADFNDIVNFWNLRASAKKILFYDPNYSDRIKNQCANFLSELRKKISTDTRWKEYITIWSETDSIQEINEFGSDLVHHNLNIHSWSGYNIKAPQMQFKDKSVLGAVSDKRKTKSITFQLPEKPFLSDPYFHTQYVATNIRSGLDLWENEEGSIRPPAIPELNEYFGRKYYFEYDKVRSNQHGISVFTNATTDSLTINALNSQELISKIFEVYGYKAEPSQPGLIASRLIKQFGGVQGCRVLKITGVRKLIEKYSASESFSRSNAVQIIGDNDPKTGIPNFSDFERLYIEQRSTHILKSEDAFKYLLNNDVFRIGLKYVCPDCQLDFWLSIDDSKKKIKCEYCGNEFDISSQLNDRDWAYRRSGLFGKENNQEGSIAVAITLQQLDTILGPESIRYTTGLNLISKGGDKCEIDFALLNNGFDNKPKLVIGECKTRKAIDEKDINNLIKLADSINSERVKVFIVVAKLSEFTPEEIILAKKAQSEYRRRIILLSARELEPYHVYERAIKEYELNTTVISLEDLAETTHQLYFDPKPKSNQQIDI